MDVNYEVIFVQNNYRYELDTDQIYVYFGYILDAGLLLDMFYILGGYRYNKIQNGFRLVEILVKLDTNNIHKKSCIWCIFEIHYAIFSLYFQKMLVDSFILTVWFHSFSVICQFKVSDTVLSDALF